MLVKNPPPNGHGRTPACSSASRVQAAGIRPGAIPRRTVLRGLGASLSLPLLESMTCGGGEQAHNANRMVVLMTDLGMLPQYWFPKGVGFDYEDSRYTKVVSPFRKRMTIVTGSALPGVDGQHDADICYLTGTPRPQSPSFRNGESLDVFAASHIGKDTRYSLINTCNNAGRSMSFSRSGSRVPPLADPVALYNKLFVGNAAEAKEQVARLESKKSILDKVLEPSRALQQKVSAADKERLDQYYTAVRDAEAALVRAIEWSAVAKPKASVTAPDHNAYAGDTLLISLAFQKLISLAIQTDQTRVATMLVSGAFGTKFRHAGKEWEVHGLSHHAGDPEKIEALAHYEESVLGILVALLRSLDEVQEEGQTLLDRTTVLFGSHLLNGHSHSQANLPTILAGGGFKHRGLLTFEGDGYYPLTNLYVSMLHKLGIETERFSSSTGTMRGLEA
ncbi:MAG: DUF1552 domain-containing protein [Planctomycetes bacterium]|nr:DUF1552 domain-containing protein [Planctomycetota bacterium]